MTDRLYKRYLIVVLIGTLAFSFQDRFALGVVMQGIKRDLSLNDTQLGMLSGIAFALFYSVLGVPIARWADSGNRITIISLATALSAVMVALCGFATNFWQLLLIRVGVSIGEAGCMPPGSSLLADYFPRSERPRATARYMLGGPLATLTGFFAAGWINQLYGWRVTFWVLALPGIVLAILVKLTLKDPRFQHRAAVAYALSAPGSLRAGGATPPPYMSTRQVFALLWANRTFRQVLLFFCIFYFFGNGIVLWQPTFFVRTYGWQTGELGTWYALAWGCGGLFGTYCGGELAGRYAANDERLQLKAIGVAMVLMGALSAMTYLAHSARIAFSMVTLTVTINGALNGPALALVQTLVPERMRATALAIILLFANLIGLGLGPLVTGLLSDSLSRVAGQNSLRYALLLLCPGYIWAAWHACRAAATVESDIDTDSLHRRNAVTNTL